MSMSPQQVVDWIKFRGGTVSVVDGKGHLHWDRPDPPTEEEIEDALGSGFDVMMAWAEALHAGRSKPVTSKEGVLQGDGIVDTSGTKLVRGGEVIAEGRLLIFSVRRQRIGGEMQRVVEAWFENGVKVRAAQWLRGAWKDGVFTISGDGD